MSMDKPATSRSHQRPYLVRTASAPSVVVPSPSPVSCQQPPEPEPTVPWMPRRTHPTMAAVDQEKSKCRYPERENYPDHGKPRLPDKKHGCNAMACHRCFGLGRQKSWASLDAVMKGDNLPDVATGHSCSPMGARLVANAEIVKNIGFRAVPLVRSSSLAFSGLQF
jgi:hypothetical protein